MLTSARDLDFAERAVISRALSPEQQLGATVEGTLKLATMPVYYGVGIYNGCGRVDQCPGGIDNDGDKEFTGRFAFSPPMPFGNLTIGLNADHRTFNVTDKNNNATSSAGATDNVTSRITGTPNYRFNPIGPTGTTLAGNGVGGTQNGFLIRGDRNTGGGDIVFDFYPFIIKGEYAYAFQEREGLGATGGDLHDLTMQGGYGAIGYWIFGNKRNGLLANARYEYLRVDDNSSNYTPAKSTKEVPLEMQSGTFGLTWYLNPSVWVRGNYIVTDLSPNANQVGMSNSHGSNVAQQGIAELMVRF
jgi:phosphate-selective porin